VKNRIELGGIPYDPAPKEALKSKTWVPFLE